MKVCWNEKCNVLFMIKRFKLSSTVVNKWMYKGIPRGTWKYHFYQQLQSHVIKIGEFIFLGGLSTSGNDDSGSNNTLYSWKWTFTSTKYQPTSTKKI